MCEDMQVMHDRAAAEVEEVLTAAAIAGAWPLPMADMRERMFDRHTLAQRRPALGGGLALAQLREEPFIRVDMHAAAGGAGGAALAQRAGLALLPGEAGRRTG